MKNSVKYTYEKWAAMSSFSDSMADQLIEANEIRVRHHLHYGLSEIIMHLDVATRELAKQKWPSDWWQAFKERWFPEFILRRWPVEYTSFEMKELAPITRPNFNPCYVLVQDGKPLKWKSVLDQKVE